MTMSEDCEWGGKEGGNLLVSKETTNMKGAHKILSAPARKHPGKAASLRVRITI
jgi:hypothetical protein